MSNIVAVCHSCRKRHTYSGRGHVLYDRIGEWWDKHPRGKCDVDFFADLPAHDITQRVAGYGHNADVKLAYASSAAYTITLTSLATSSTFTGGRESTAVSNTTGNYLDYLVGGVIRTGGTAPTDNTEIRIYGYGSVNDTPTYPDVLDGTDSDETITDSELLGVAIKLLHSTAVDTSTNQDYWFAPLGIAAIFNGAIPKNHGLFVTHNTGQNLNSTGSNHVLSYTGVYLTVA